MARTTRTIDTPAGPGTVELDGEPVRGLILLTHGAGGGVQTPDLLAVRTALVARGFGVGLVTQPYRLAGRRTPPRPEPQDAAWLALTAATPTDVPLIVGGRSNGARVACRTARAAGARAVLALAFPLHPPGKPQNSRVAELDGAGVPTLVVQGERDPFGMPPAGVDREVVAIAGDHSLKRDAAALTAAVEAFVDAVLPAEEGGR